MASAQPHPHPSRSTYQEAILISGSKKPAAKKAAKRKPAAQTPQVNRTASPSTEEPPETPDREETQEDRDAAGRAREEKVRTPGKDSVEDYEPKREELQHAGYDHYAAEEERQAELAEQRDEHNERVAHGRGFKF